MRGRHEAGGGLRRAFSCNPGELSKTFRLFELSHGVLIEAPAH